MGKTRKIKKILKSKPTIEGAGVHLKRAFGFYQVPLLDPFLLLDDFHSNDPEDYIRGFPWHPHRGIETITYVLTRQGGTWGQYGKQGDDFLWRCPMDDGRQRDYSPGNAKRAEGWIDVGLPTLGKSPRFP